MPVLADFQDFVFNHRRHGPLTADATEPTWNGYLLTVVCSSLDGTLGVPNIWPSPRTADHLFTAARRV